MTKKNTFQCGTCNLIETGLSEDELIELSVHHFSGKHITIDDIRKKKRRKTSSRRIKR